MHRTMPPRFVMTTPFPAFDASAAGGVEGR